MAGSVNEGDTRQGAYEHDSRDGGEQPGAARVPEGANVATPDEAPPRFKRRQLKPEHMVVLAPPGQ